MDLEGIQHLVKATSKEQEKAEWLDYYSWKRITHQWKQLELLGSVKCHKILEVGPGQGLVTAMLANAGYDVQTLDFIPPVYSSPVTPHMLKDVFEVKGEEIAGYDAIICCETLEHVDWEKTGKILSTFRASGAKYLLISVPYMGLQLTFDFYINGYIRKSYFSLKKLLSFKTFPKEPPGGHQWEVGYKGHSLKTWEKRITDSGWKIRKRDFTEHCRSVFHLLEVP